MNLAFFAAYTGFHSSEQLTLAESISLQDIGRAWFKTQKCDFLGIFISPLICYPGVFTHLHVLSGGASSQSPTSTLRLLHADWIFKCLSCTSIVFGKHKNVFLIHHLRSEQIFRTICAHPHLMVRCQVMSTIIPSQSVTPFGSWRSPWGKPTSIALGIFFSMVEFVLI